MRNVLRLSLLVLTVAVYLGSARAQGPPPGSYRQSCVNIQMRNWTLFANCQDMDGRWRSAVLPDVRGCVGDVTNINGELRCNRGEGWRGGDNFPRGSYRETCRDLRMRGDMLFARCETISGRWARSSLDDVQHCVGEIVNDDGQLQCSRAPWQASGPYMQTCSPVYVRGDDLRARCATRDGRWVWTSLDHYEACRAPIVNWDGQLRCGGGDRDADHDRDRDRDQGRDRDHDEDRDRDRPRLPGGTWSQSCRDVEMQGDRLHARCQTRDGDWRWTDLDDAWRCRQGVVNIDGHLVCAQ
ncbi:MAG TPA: CVNH domain-containing protein [Candidatus Angelobacter sp.]|nr:CVNH domain-containing protein [Candidatus Angelobacter sp.]